ncbi:MAG: Gx transporter family protein [Brevinematia bacterium]
MQLLNDVRNYNTLSKEEKLNIIAFLTAVSSLLSVIDAILTGPFLIKLGMANLITLILINEKRALLAFFVLLSRIFISSLMTGSLLTLAFLLSLSGGLTSWGAMYIARILFKKASLIGISVIGAFFHIIGQSIWIIIFFGFTNSNIFLISLFSMVGIITGIIVGVLGNLFYKSLAL